MGFYEKENNGFSELYRYVSKNSDKTYVLVYDNKSITATFDCMYESDNGLDENEAEYEEYHAIGFINSDNNELFEINYSNMPTSVMCGDEIIL